MASKFQKVHKGISLKPQASDPVDAENGDFYYNSTLNKYRRYENGIWKNIGSGSGVGDVDILSADTAEDANLADYTQTGLEILLNIGGGEMHSDTAFRLIHQPASTRSFKKTIAVDRKFRGKNNTLQLDVRSTALQANLTLLVRDETNSADLLASTQIQTDSVSFGATTSSGSPTLTALSVSDFNLLTEGDSVTGAGIATGSKILSKNLSALSVTLTANATASATVTLRASGLPARRIYTFDVPATCASMSWTISALQEASLPETYIDDVLVKLTSTAKTNASYSQTTYNTTEPVNYTPAVSGVGTPTNVNFSWERNGHMMKIKGSLTAGGSPSGNVILPLPAGYFIDTTSPNGIKSIVGGGAKVGTLFTETSSGVAQNYFSGGYTAIAFYDGSDTSNLYFSLQTQSGVFNKQTWGNFGSASEGGSFEIEVPIAGWTNTTTSSQTIELSSSILATEPDAYIKTSVANGYGATNTAVRRYSNITDNLGKSISYQDSASLGGSFTILEDGEYSIHATENSSTDGGASQITKNSTTLNALTSVEAERLADCRKAGTLDQSWQMSWTGPLKIGDVIRIQATSTATAVNQVKCSISKNGRMKVLNPSSDQKIDIPTHELRFEGASTLGATDTKIVKFDTLSLVTGDGFTVVNTAANGTVVTIQKAGTLTISSSLFRNAAMETAITRNQTALTTNPSSLPANQLLAANYANTSVISAPSWSGTVKPGDVIRICADVAPTSDPANTLNFILQETKVGVALSNVVPQFTDGDGFLELSNYNGVGATRTRIARFSNLIQQDGLGKFTYTDSASDGGSITVNEDGVYNIIWGWGSANNAAIGLALTRNEVLSSTGSTDGTSLSRAQGLIASAYVGAISTALTLPVVSYSGKLNKGDVIRCHTDGNTTNPNPSLTYFNITKVGKPSITNVDVTPFVNLKTQEYQTLRLFGGTTYGSTATKIPRFGSVLENPNSGIFRYADDAALGASITALRDCKVTVSYADSLSAIYATLGLSLNSVNLTTNIESLPAAEQLGYTQTPVSTGQSAITVSVNMKVGDVIRPHTNGVARSVNLGSFTVLAVADTTSVVSAAKTYRMSDYLANGTRVTGTAPTALGQYRSYLRTGGGTTFTETNGAPTNAPSLTNGIYLSRGSSFAGTDPNNDPTRYEIFIGKNKNFEVVGYASTGRTGQADLTPTLVGTAESSGYVTSYDPTSGVLTLTRFIPSSAITNSGQAALTSTGAGSGAIAYCDINVFDTPMVSQSFQRRLAYIRDEKATATDGGTFTAGSDVTRVLNTLIDPTGIVTSLSSNAFTLPAGTYRIRAEAPAFQVAENRATLRNTTDSVNTIRGQSSYSTVTNGPTANAVVAGVFTITSSKTFEIRHRCSSTKSGNGFGVNSNYGESEVYTTVEIEKLN